MLLHHQRKRKEDLLPELLGLGFMCDLDNSAGVDAHLLRAGVI